MKLKQLIISSLTGVAGMMIPLVVRANSKPIIVGSKNVSESKTVSEIYALALEHDGYKVTRKPNISNNVIFKAAQKGQVDIYPEYTGTIVESYLKKDGQGKSATQMAKIARDGIKKDGLTTFNYAPGDNRQGVGMPTKVAKKYHIKNLIIS